MPSASAEGDVKRRKVKAAVHCAEGTELWKYAGEKGIKNWKLKS